MAVGALRQLCGALIKIRVVTVIRIWYIYLSGIVALYCEGYSRVTNAAAIGIILVAEVKGVECSKFPALGSVCRLINVLETTSLVKNEWKCVNAISECERLELCHAIDKINGSIYYKSQSGYTWKSRASELFFFYKTGRRIKRYFLRLQIHNFLNSACVYLEFPYESYLNFLLSLFVFPYKFAVSLLTFVSNALNSFFSWRSFSWPLYFLILPFSVRHIFLVNLCPFKALEITFNKCFSDSVGIHLWSIFVHTVHGWIHNVSSPAMSYLPQILWLTDMHLLLTHCKIYEYNLCLYVRLSWSWFEKQLSPAKLYTLFVWVFMFRIILTINKVYFRKQHNFYAF